MSLHEKSSTTSSQYTPEEIAETERRLQARREYADLRAKAINAQMSLEEYQQQEAGKAQKNDLANLLFFPFKLLLAPLMAFNKQEESTGQIETGQTSWSPPQVPLPHMLLPEIAGFPVGNIPNFGGLPEPGLGRKDDRAEKFEEESRLEKF
jgi:hypothetical protein